MTVNGAGFKFYRYILGYVKETNSFSYITVAFATIYNGNAFYSASCSMYNVSVCPNSQNTKLSRRIEG
jgi:hypothetical protein